MWRSIEGQAPAQVGVRRVAEDQQQQQKSEGQPSHDELGEAGTSALPSRQEECQELSNDDDGSGPCAELKSVALETSMQPNNRSGTGQEPSMQPLCRRRRQMLLLHRSPSWQGSFGPSTGHGASSSAAFPSLGLAASMQQEQHQHQGKILANVEQPTTLQSRRQSDTTRSCAATATASSQNQQLLPFHWTCDGAQSLDEGYLSFIARRSNDEQHSGMRPDASDRLHRDSSDCGEEARSNTSSSSNSSSSSQLIFPASATSTNISSQTASNDLAYSAQETASPGIDSPLASPIDVHTSASSSAPVQPHAANQLRQRRAAAAAPTTAATTTTLAERGMQTSMVSSYDDEETASFLPGGNAAARKPATGKRARICLNGVMRRRRAIALLCLVTAIGTLSYLFGPQMLGEERMQRLDSKLDTTIRPFLHGIGFGPPPPPPEGLPPPPPPLEGPVATTPTGNKIYKPITKLPLGYDDPIPSSEDAVRLGQDAFPPELAISPIVVKPVDLGPQHDANPHHGQIPSVQLQRLRHSTSRKRPPMPVPVEPYPKEMYTPRRTWSAETDGSRTTHADAMRFNELKQGQDWRPPPYNTWKAPKLKTGESAMPSVQYHFSAPNRHSGFKGQTERDIEIQERQQLVKDAFLYAWEAYKARAWGHDEIKPVTGAPSDSFNGWGATIVDALDTLLVMDLPDEYDLARQHVRDIDFHLLGGSRSAYGTSDGRIPVFETAIRYLGGFLSAYDLSGDVMMRHRAEELAQLILPAFNTPTGVPLGRLRFDAPPNRRYSTGGVILAEAASMLLEMTRLWQVTGNRTYFDTVQRTTDWLDHNMTSTPDRLGSLLPTSIFPERGTMYGWYSWGGMVDSAYEYLIKEHQLLGGKLSQYGRMFSDVVDSAQKWLIRDLHTVPNAPLLVLGHSNGRSFSPKLEHLTCFAGGTIGLGARLLPHRKRDLAHAERISEACWWMYNATATGIGPEEVTFFKDKDTDRFETVQVLGGTSRRGKARGSPIVGVRSISPDYRNRPETIESVFYMWRITGDPKWQERGWQMFSSWVTHGMSHYGFSSIFDVMHVPVQHTDSMESFVFAETFKYYYLLFSPPELISLDDYVFTTEAHPLLTPKHGKWGQAGNGPRKLWDPAAQHVPNDPSKEYAGGELGPLGGLTHVQKNFLSEKHRKQLADAEAAKKAKESSLLNVVKLNSESIRNMLQNNIPGGSRLSVEDLKNAVAQVSARAQQRSADDGTDTDHQHVVDVVLQKRDDGSHDEYELVFEEHEEEEQQPHDQHAECGDNGVLYNADGTIDEYYESDGYGECLA